jgi:putative copper export protein
LKGGDAGQVNSIERRSATGLSMQRLLAIGGHWLHGLAFAVWVGGLMAIGALTVLTSATGRRKL